jgi:hypothetical protein
MPHILPGEMPEAMTGSKVFLIFHVCFGFVCVFNFSMFNFITGAYVSSRLQVFIPCAYSRSWVMG